MAASLPSLVAGPDFPVCRPSKMETEPFGADLVVWGWWMGEDIESKGEIRNLILGILPRVTTRSSLQQRISLSRRNGRVRERERGKREEERRIRGAV